MNTNHVSLSSQADKRLRGDELNPVEQCWNQMKNVQMANFVPFSIEDIVAKTLEAAQVINNDPKLLAAFFHHAKLALGGMCSRQGGNARCVVSCTNSSVTPQAKTVTIRLMYRLIVKRLNRWDKIIASRTFFRHFGVKESTGYSSP
jgi:hypothetical protein